MQTRKVLTPRTLPNAARQAALAEKAELAANLASCVTNPVWHLEVPTFQSHLHLTLRYHVHGIDDAERTTAHCSEQRYASHTPKNKFEIEVTGDMRAVVGFADRHGEYSVRNHPHDHHVCTDGTIIVLLLSGFADTVLGNFKSIPEIAQGLVIAGVDVELLAGHFQFDCVAFAAHRCAEIDMNYVVAFGAPADVVRVTEGIYLQCADVRR